MFSLILARLGNWLPNAIVKVLLYMFAAFAVVETVWVTYFQYQTLKTDPIYAATFFINIVVVISTAVYSYKSFGKDLRALKKNMAVALANLNQHDKDIGDVYGHLRDFGNRLHKLDGIHTQVKRETGNKVVIMED